MTNRRNARRFIAGGILALLGLFAGLAAEAQSLRFYGGNSANDADRVKIRIDDPADRSAGPPADVGADDFTIEFWIRADANNRQPAVECSAYQYIWGNIVVDRDRYEQGRAFGISLADGHIVFSVQIQNHLSETICGSSDLRDGDWHHVAVQRRFADGRMWIFVDGKQEAAGTGPRGDISYPDDGMCNAPEICTDSDPYLVLGAEKHNLAAGFSGWLAEVRLSNTLRYPGSVPTAPFAPDRFTAALYHFDEGEGDVIGDAAPGGLSPGERRFGAGGGERPGPEWSADSPFGPQSP